MNRDGFEFITFNVKGWLPMRQRKVREDFARVADQKADVYFWQEHWWRRYRRGLKSVFKNRTKNSYAHSPYPGKSGTCISWNHRRFDRRWFINRPLHGAVPFVCAKRQIQGAVLHDEKTGEDFVFVSAHLSPWAKGKGKKAQDEGLERLRRFLAHHVRMGRRLVLGMDANCKVERVMEAFKGLDVHIIVSKETGIDYLILLGDWHVQAHSAMRKGLVHSDHAPLMVRAK